jgi:hypothetical protein
MAFKGKRFRLLQASRLAMMISPACRFSHGPLPASTLGPVEATPTLSPIASAVIRQFAMSPSFDEAFIGATTHRCEISSAAARCFA